MDHRTKRTTGMYKWLGMHIFNYSTYLMSYYRMKNLKMALDHGAIAKFSTGPLNLRAWEALYENTRKKISLLLAQISIF